MRKCNKVFAMLAIMSMVISILQVCPAGVEAATVGKTTVTSVKETGDANVTVTWKKVPRITGYVVYRKTGKNGKYKKLKKLSGSSTVKYVDKTTKDSTTYYYAVKTYKGKQYSPCSAGKMIKTSGTAKVRRVYNDCTAVLANTPTRILFKADVKNGRRLKGKSLALYRGSRRIGYLADNGKNGDDISGDGIFSISDTLNAREGDAQTYHVRYNKKELQSFEVKVFDEVSDQDMEELGEIDSAINGISADYEVDGIVPVESKLAAINSVYERTQKLIEEGKVLESRKNEYGVSMQLESGIWYNYSPADKDVNSNPGKSVVTIQPYNLSGGDMAHPTDLIDTVAGEIADRVSGLRLGSNIDDQSVTLAMMSSLGKDQVIIWDGHGSYDDEEGPLLATGMENGSQKEIKDSDLVSGCLWYSNGGGRILVSPKWFSRNIKSGQFRDSAFYFTTCYGGKDSRLAQELINKGADSVVAFSDSVYTLYCWDMCKSIFDKMTERNKDTGYLYTLDEAVAYASDKWEDNDLAYAVRYHSDKGLRAKTPAYIRLFGKKAYRLTDECFATLKLSRETIDLKEGETTVIKATTNINPKNLIWRAGSSSVMSLKVSEDGNSVTIKGIKPGSTVFMCAAGNKICKCALTVRESDIVVKGLPDGEYLTRWTGTKEKTISLWNETYPASSKIEMDGDYLIIRGSLTKWNGNAWNKKFTTYAEYKFKVAKNCRIVSGNEGMPDTYGIDKVRETVKIYNSSSKKEFGVDSFQFNIVLKNNVITAVYAPVC